MFPSAGLVDSLNKMREMSVKEGSIYHQFVPIITDTTSIGEFGQPILDNPEVRNEFMSKLFYQVIGTRINTRNYKNRLSFLEKETQPLGGLVRNIHINPIKGRRFNVNDFAGLLKKYDADIKVYHSVINLDEQYPVTITREKLRTAFNSWNSFNSFIDGIYTALYNSAENDRYEYTKMLVSNTFRNNAVQYEVVDNVVDEATSKALVTKMRAYFLNFQEMSQNYNGWNKIMPTDTAVKTVSDAGEVVILIRNDILATNDVQSLAASFNMNKADFLGRVVGVNNFDIHNDDGEVVYDGSSILGIIADRSYFDIHQQDFALDEFYNANNRCWNLYLNQTYSYQYSPFANAIVFTTAAPTVDATDIEAEKSEVSVVEGAKVVVPFTVTPVTATTTITATSSAEGKATVEVKGRTVEITGVDDGSATITLSAGAGVTDTISVTVTAAEA